MKSQMSFIGMVVGFSVLLPAMMAASLSAYLLVQTQQPMVEMHNSFYDMSVMLHSNSTALYCSESPQCAALIAKEFDKAYGLEYIGISSPFSSASYGNMLLCTDSYYSCMSYVKGTLLCVYECD